MVRLCHLPTLPPATTLSQPWAPEVQSPGPHIAVQVNTESVARPTPFPEIGNKGKTGLALLCDENVSVKRSVPGGRKFLLKQQVVRGPSRLVPHSGFRGCVCMNRQVTGLSAVVAAFGARAPQTLCAARWVPVEVPAPPPDTQLSHTVPRPPPRDRACPGPSDCPPVFCSLGLSFSFLHVYSFLLFWIETGCPRLDCFLHNSLWFELELAQTPKFGVFPVRQCCLPECSETFRPPVTDHNLPDVSALGPDPGGRPHRRSGPWDSLWHRG